MKDVMMVLAIVAVGAGYAALMNRLRGEKHLLGNRIRQTLQTLRGEQ